MSVTLITTQLILFGSVIGWHFVTDQNTTASFFFDFFIVAQTLWLKIACDRRKSYHLNYLAIFLILYLVVNAQLFYLNYPQGDWLQFMRSSRWVLYCVLFVLCVDARYHSIQSKLANVRSLPFVVTVVFVICGAVYLSKLGSGNSRPTVFAENNFEAPLFLALGVILSYSLNKNRLLFVSYLLSFISLSKSAALAAAYVVSFRLCGSRSIGQALIGIILVFFALAISIYVFETRLAGKDIWAVDRLRFLNVLAIESKDSNLIQIIFGHGIATKLSQESCQALWPWARNIFDDFRDCNSVVLHSFFMRLFYDCGIFGFLVLGYVWMVFAKKVFSRDVCLLLMGIYSINSLSVSGFNNSIVIFASFLVLLTNYGRSEVMSHSPDLRESARVQYNQLR